MWHGSNPGRAPINWGFVVGAVCVVGFVTRVVVRRLLLALAEEARPPTACRGDVSTNLLLYDSFPFSLSLIFTLLMTCVIKNHCRTCPWHANGWYLTFRLPTYHHLPIPSHLTAAATAMGAFLGKFTDACGITTPTADVVLVGCGCPKRGMGWYEPRPHAVYHPRTPTTTE